MAPVGLPLEPDPEQGRVLDHARGTMLVTGPPGSGKTVLLRERFARFVEGGTAPERVVLFTLNRRAAREARDWLLHRIGRSVADLPVFTAHGYAFRVLGRHFRELGYDQPPRILSAPEQYTAVREMLGDERPEDWPRFGRLLRVAGFARQVADFVLRAQERLLSPEQVEELAERPGRPEHIEVARFYRRYLDGLGRNGRIDFAGLLFQTVTLLERGVGNEERFEHVLVDDFQDATHATEGIVRALAGAAQSVVVAADPHGHVFSYRGGTLQPLRRIGETLGLTGQVELLHSHRMGDGLPALMALAAPGSAPPEPAPGLEARSFVHPGEEVEAVARELLQARVDEEVPWERMAVIVRRYGEYVTALRHALARHGIPFVLVAEASAVASEPANRPVIDLLRYVFQEGRRDELVEGLLVSPVGGLDPHELRALRREARRRDLTLRELMDSDVPAPGPLAEQVDRLRKVVRELPARATEPDAAFFWLWSTLPWFRELVASEGGRHRDLDALAALGDVLARFVERRPGSTTLDYLNTLEAAEFGPDPWVLPEERRPHAVRIVSAHRAQGQEFDVAMVVGCLEGEFPILDHRFPVVDIDRLVDPASTAASRTRERLAEERALFRLAVSRARRRTVLFASSSASSRNPRTPSRFVDRLGVAWARGDGEPAPSASLRSMEADLRRRLADPAAPPPARLAAAAILPEAGARPRAWWGGRDWTDPGAPLHPDELQTSYSRLSTLENCGLQYLYEVEMGLDPESTHQMWLGGLVHAVIERVQKGELARDEAAVLAALHDAWEPERFPNRAVERQKRRDAETMVRNWLRGEGVPPEESEVWFEFPIDGARLRGRIDAVFRMANGHARVVDYKTGRSAPTREQAQQDLQLAAYFLALRRDERLQRIGEPRILELAYLLQSRRREAFLQLRVLPASIEGYEEWAEGTIKDLLGKVRAERFAPNPEADCFFCKFKSICPVWPQGAEVRT